MARSEPPILVFDGICVLCSRWVRFVLRHDRAGRIRLAAMQSASGRRLLEGFGLDPDDPVSLLYVVDGRGLTDSDAILGVLRDLGGIWTVGAVARIVPRAWRDALYRRIARNRYRWFGRNDACFMPQPDQTARFLD